MNTASFGSGFANKVLMAPLLPSSLYTFKTSINIFEQVPEEVQKVRSQRKELQRVFGVLSSHLNLSHNPSFLEPGTENQEKPPNIEIAFLQNIELDTLVEMAQVDPLYWDNTEEFLFELRDSFIRMMDAIIERNPDNWNTMLPQDFPEIEIYDSVVGIIDDEELDELNVALGGEPKLMTEVVRASIGVFSGLQALVCKQPSWKDNVTVPDSFDTHGIARFTHAPWVPFESITKEITGLQKPLKFVKVIKPIDRHELFQVIPLVKKYGDSGMLQGKK